MIMKLKNNKNSYLIELGHIIQKLFYYLFKIIFLFYDYQAQKKKNIQTNQHLLKSSSSFTVKL